MEELLNQIKECIEQLRLAKIRIKEAERIKKIIGFNYKNQNK